MKVSGGDLRFQKIERINSYAPASISQLSRQLDKETGRRQRFFSLFSFRSNFLGDLSPDRRENNRIQLGGQFFFDFSIFFEAWPSWVFWFDWFWVLGIFGK